MKSNKRLFIEKYFSGFVYVLEKNGVSINSIEQELSLAIEKDDYANTGRTFELTREQLDKYNIWATKHIEKIRKIDREIKISFSFMFSDTGIGTHVKAVCNLDNVSIDLTDYSNW